MDDQESVGQLAVPKAGETVWRNKHGFRLKPELCSTDYSTTPPTVTPYVACFKCGDRADGPRALRQCLGVYAKFYAGTGTLVVPVTVTPNGRKPITEDIHLDVDGLIELVEILRQFPKDEYGRSERGHGFWHWQNPDREFPCSMCPDPIGEAARRLESAQRDAIDVDAVPLAAGRRN
jgi:hypothetical protein